METCESIRHQVNEDLFLFAFITAIVHRPDTQGISPPRVQDVYPDKFFTHNVITKIKEAVNRGEKVAIFFNFIYQIFFYSAVANVLKLWMEVSTKGAFGYEY